MSNIEEKQLEFGNLLDENNLQLVTFFIAEEEFAVEILDVHEIIRIIQITPVPNTAPFLEGVINLRGNVIPVVNLRKRFGLEGIEMTSKSRIIVMEVSQRIMGFLVDEVSEVLSINSNIVEESPAVVSGVDSEYIRGVANMPNGLLILLNLSALLEMSPLVANSNKS